MSSHALLSAVLQKLPVRKTSQAGKPYLMASARDGKGPDAKWWTVFAFTEAAIEALEVLVEGEAFAATGTFDATIWAPEGREPRVNLTLTADAILSARKPKAKSEGTKRPPRLHPQSDRAARSWASPSLGGDLDDSIPFYPDGERGRTPMIPGIPPPPSGPDDYGVSPEAVAVAAFKVERWGEITFDLDEEFLIDGVIPKQGVGLIYGASQSFKSFAAKHMGLCVACEPNWAGRKTESAPVVYLAAEGAAGLRKRKAGYVKAGRAPPNDVDFALISAAPNLGADKGDYGRLVATIETAGIKPGLIIIDTVAKVIGGADENGAGMAQFLVNAEALATHFSCFVLSVHHVGWNEEAKDRPRGWSGLPAALDVQILCERKAGEMSATLTLQKLKDEPSGLRLDMQMARVVLGVSETGREVSTLIVDEVIEAEAAPATATRCKSVPKSQRLLMDVVALALDEKGAECRPLGAINVRAVADRHIRERYFARIAEKAAPGEDERRLYDRQLKAFNRALKTAIDAQSLVASEHKGERLIWKPTDRTDNTDTP